MVVTLDTVGFAVPTNGWRESSPPLVTDRGGRLVLRSGARARIGAPSAHGWSYVTASLPKVMTGSNITGLPVAELGHAVSTILGDLAAYVVVDRGARLGDLPTHRIDAVRDFDDVQNFDVLVRGLQRVPRAKALREHLYGHRGRAETLTVGTTTWSQTLYNKFVETEGVAPMGRARCELRLRTRRLRSVWARDHGGRIGCMADVTEEKITTMAKTTFDEVGFGMAVASFGEVLHEIYRLPIKPAEQAGLLMYLATEAEGLQTNMSEKSERKYRQLARTLGFQIAPDAQPGSIRLDWASGTQIAA